MPSLRFPFNLEVIPKVFKPSWLLGVSSADEARILIRNEPSSTATTEAAGLGTFRTNSSNKT